MDFDKIIERDKEFVAKCFYTAKKGTLEAVLHRISVARSLGEMEAFVKAWLEELESEDA